MGLSPSKLKKFRKVEPWIVTVLLGKLPRNKESEATRHLLDVHAGIAEPNTEIERMWLAYWDRRLPMISDLQEVYFGKAQRIQRIFGSNRNVVYDDVVEMYRMASLCGSVKADDWLREQSLEPMRTNTIWQCGYQHGKNVRWGVNR